MGTREKRELKIQEEQKREGRWRIEIVRKQEEDEIKTNLDKQGQKQ